MTSVLHRRLARIEAALKPAPEQCFTVLIEPDIEALAAEWQLHHQAIEDARARGDRIGVVRSSGCGDTDQIEPGIEYFESEIDSCFAVLASQRSEKGKADRLADLLDSLPGNVIGVVANPVDCEDAP